VNPGNGEQVAFAVTGSGSPVYSGVANVFSKLLSDIHHAHNMLLTQATVLTLSGLFPIYALTTIARHYTTHT
jgi:hypothetical protein